MKKQYRETIAGLNRLVEQGIVPGISYALFDHGIEYREVKDDINCFFENYGSAGRELSTYSYWEQNGKSEWVYKKDFITNEYGFGQPRKKINSLIDKF